MIIKITYCEEDYLTNFLFEASKSKTIKKKELRGNLTVCFAFIILGILFWLTKNESLKNYFFACAVLNLLIYPAYYSYRLKKNYQKFVKENYQQRIGKEFVYDYQREQIVGNSEAGEFKIYTKEIAQIIEIETFIFIKFKSGNSFIIPKAQIDEDEFWVILNEIISDKVVEICKELDWKWR